MKLVSVVELSVQPRVTLVVVVPVTFSKVGASNAGVAAGKQLDHGELPNVLIARILYEYVVPGFNPVFWKDVTSNAGVAIVAQPAAGHPPITL